MVVITLITEKEHQITGKNLTWWSDNGDLVVDDNDLEIARFAAGKWLSIRVEEEPSVAPVIPLYPSYPASEPWYPWKIYPSQPQIWYSTSTGGTVDEDEKTE